jgi:DNA-binding response OmpR family regulator
MLTDNPSAPFILIVEDDDHAVLIKRSFGSSPEEYRLAAAMDLHATRQILSDDSPDLVLADYCLPDGKGSDLLKMVKGVCPVIIMTSQGDDQLEAKVKEVGALDYVVKSGAGFASMPHVVNLAMRQWASIREREGAESISTKGSTDSDG